MFTKVSLFTAICLPGLLTMGLTSASAASVGDASPSLFPALENAGDELLLSFAPEAPLAPYARAGWQAPLSTLAHNVSGTVTILDADTFRVDNFYYNGGGINVHFILAAADNYATLSTARLVTDLNLLGTAYNGGSVTVDLPSGTNFDGYNAISVWCLPASANFGSGTFVNTAPEPAGTSLLALGAVALGSFRRSRSK